MGKRISMLMFVVLFIISSIPHSAAAFVGTQEPSQTIEDEATLVPASPVEAPLPSVPPVESPLPSVPPVEAPLPSVPPAESPLPSVPPVEAPLPSVPPVEAPLPSVPPVEAPLPSVPPAEAPSPPIEPPLAPREVPAFSAELVHIFDGWGLYGTLSVLTPDMEFIVPRYSLDGETYLPEPYNKWILSSELLYDQRQQFFWPIDTPLKEYLSGEISQFYIDLEITYIDGSTVSTQPVFFKKEGPQELPKDVQITAWYASPLSMITYEPFHIWGQYSLSVPDTITQEELSALLPTTVPVELQIEGFGSTKATHTTVVNYTVIWPELTQPIRINTVLSITALQVVPPEECSIALGSDTYLLDWLSEVPFYNPELIASIHIVPDHTTSTLLLSSDESLESPSLSATLPIKPTGAEQILLEYSINGETDWITLWDVLVDTPLDSLPPKLTSYTSPILDANAPPMKAYLAGQISGFYVRFSISGSAFSGSTEKAEWPTDYYYVPPYNDSNEEGGTGNRGDAGSGNTGNSALTGGQRPTVSTELRLPPLALTPEFTPTQLEKFLPYPLPLPTAEPVKPIPIEPAVIPTPSLDPPMVPLEPAPIPPTALTVHPQELKRYDPPKGQLTEPQFTGPPPELQQDTQLEPQSEAQLTLSSPDAFAPLPKQEPVPPVSTPSRSTEQVQPEGFPLPVLVIAVLLGGGLALTAGLSKGSVGKRLRNLIHRWHN